MTSLDKSSLATGYLPNKSSETRSENDYYPTPAIATLTLLMNHPVPLRILEPAAGEGYISKELIRNGHEVISSDLYEYENPLVDINFGIDFLTDKRHNVDGVITNPPFKNNLPEKLLLRCLEVHNYDFVAFLTRITWLESSRRYKLFTEHPPSKILVFSERIQCDKQLMKKYNGIGGMICYTWCIWDKSYSKMNEISWVKPSDYIDLLEK